MNDEHSRRERTVPGRVLDRLFAGCRTVEGWIASHPWITFAATGLICVVVELVTRGFPRSWDWVWLSGMVAVSLGLPPAFRMNATAEYTVGRLADRGVLTDGTDELVRQTDRHGELIGRYAGPCLAVFVLIGFATRAVTQQGADGRSAWFADVGNNGYEVLLACLAAFFVGRAAGRVLAIATLGQRIEKGRLPLRAQLGHVDGAAGLKPIGDLYFGQAMIVAIPAVWLVVVLCLKSLSVVGGEGWSALGQVVGQGSGWGPWYFLLLVIAVGLEIAAFIAPMGSFHRAMLSQKRDYERDADKQSQILDRLLDELPAVADEADRKTAERRIAGIREHNSRVEQMPTWPVDASVRRRFTFRNGLLLVPVIANAIGIAVEADSWNTLGDILGG